MLAGWAMQSKLVNLSEIISNYVRCEKKTTDLENLITTIFCHCKSHIGRHLQRHFQLLLQIPIAYLLTFQIQQCFGISLSAHSQNM